MNIFENIRAQFSRYTRSQKIGMAVCGMLAMGTVWGAVHFANRLDFQLLYSDLDPQEAQGIVQKLQDAKIEFQLSDDGRSVKIPSDKIPETRIKLAGDGLPSSGRIGFEIFDQTSFGLTNFQEQVNYQRALEGELARSIMTLSEVDAARVHLVLPKDSLFQSAEDQAKASVILKLKNGRNLSESAVQGIVNVIASSVKGLAPERVTLIDYRGKVMSRPAEKGPLTTQQLDTRQRLESDFAAKITQILEPAVGAGKVRPQVSVLMNFQQVEETSERYDPQTAVRSQQKQEEHQPPSRVVGGIPGPKPQPTPPPDTGAQTAGGTTPAPVPQTDATKQNEVINYEVSKSVRHTVEPVGQISQISVAAIIDNHTKTVTGSDGKTTMQSEPRTPEEMNKYRDLIAAAVGFNMERGDRIVVENISFESEENFTALEPTFIERQGPVIVTGLRYLIVPMVFILLYMLFLRPVQKTVLAQLVAAPPVQLVGGGPQTPMTVRQLEAQLQSGSDLYPMSSDLGLPANTTKVELIRNRLAEQAQRDPETMARLVRTWMAGEKNR